MLIWRLMVLSVLPDRDLFLLYLKLVVPRYPLIRSCRLLVGSRRLWRFDLDRLRWRIVSTW